MQNKPEGELFVLKDFSYQIRDLLRRSWP